MTSNGDQKGLLENPELHTKPTLTYLCMLYRKIFQSLSSQRLKQDCQEALGTNSTLELLETW